ncbi:inactive poly [ADP-ribose] polymerase RCD1 isoform X2 [Lolium perenne]|uniref:inactive poly [ADP-ribose] polymerase RCD1 isoform X2 n=1 Tax=Lolium perenne TaxID=4522 RepID=UPI0021F606B2|nr:inactive poly [ADP-ribose] polymerase RCD1-like isoform X2 [Lolium perenne]
MDPTQKSNALCPKRKPVDDCLQKKSKSGRVEKENASSKPAHSCHSQPNLANDCVNYLKSGVPSRVVFYRQGSWCDFPDKVVKSIVDAFKEDKSSVVVVMDDQPLLVDFLSMTLVNLNTRKQRSVAWLDGTNKWSFPSSFFDEEVDESTRLGMGVGKGGAQGVLGGNVMKPPSDVAKQVMLEASPPVLQNSSALNVLRKKIVHVERGSESFMFVQNLFLSGMGSFAVPNNILHIHRYSPKDITAQCRHEAFERQMRLTGQKSGTGIARYGWLGSGKQDIVSVITNGLLGTEKITHETEIGAGIYLSPENRAFTSVGFCDVDEKGVQYMLLCRAILGNTGVIKPGSQEEFLRIYDSGVDNCSNPNYYVMWPSHLGTHISLEYLISFRLAPKVQEYFLSLKGLWLRPPPKEVKVDLSILQPVLCRTNEGPTSPWISFRVLFEAIQDSISFLARELLYRHYEELKENKITRDEMVKRMMIIVGEELLLDTLTKLKYSPSLWYNSSEKMVSSPASRTPESVSIWTRNMDVESATPSHDSDVSRPTHGNSSSLSMEGLHSVAPSMTTEAQGSIVPSREHRYSSSTDAQGIVTATPGVVCQAPQLSAAKGMEPELSAPRSMAPYLSPPRSMAHHLRGKAFRELGPPRSMAPHLSAPRSMAPHLRGKMPEVPAKITMPEACHSSAENVVSVIFEPLSSSPLPKEKSVVTSRNECLTPSSARQGPDCPSNLATTPRNTPSQKNVAPKHPAAQCGENKNFPRTGVDESSTIAYAAGTLVTLSADGEKGP